MLDIILYLFIFIIVYLFYFLFVIKRKNKLNDYKNSIEVRYLTSVYKLDVKKINLNKLGHRLALSNAFIIATTVTLVSFIPNLLLKMLVGFIILIPLQLLIYHIMGKYYKKKEVM